MNKNTRFWALTTFIFVFFAPASGLSQGDDFFSDPTQNDTTDTPATEIPIEDPVIQDNFADYRTLTIDFAPSVYVDLPRLNNMQPLGTVVCKQKAQKVCAYSALGGKSDIFIYENTSTSSSERYQVSEIQGYSLKVVTTNEKIDLQQRMINEVGDLSQVGLIVSNSNLVGKISNAEPTEDKRFLVDLGNALVVEESGSVAGFSYDDFTRNSRKVFGQRPSIETLKRQLSPQTVREEEREKEDKIVDFLTNPLAIAMIVSLLIVLLAGAIFYRRSKRRKIMNSMRRQEEEHSPASGSLESGAVSDSSDGTIVENSDLKIKRDSEEKESRE
jgi:hypothetical protein